MTGASGTFGLRCALRRDAAKHEFQWPAFLWMVAIGLLGLTFSGCRKQDFPQYPADYREYAYITNGDSGTVTVLDAVSVRIDREIPVGRDPVGVIASPTRNEVYVLNAGADNSAGSLSVIDSKKNAVVATIALGRRPVSIDLDADGALAYVANSGSNSISIIDLKARQQIAVMVVDDGRRVEV